MDPARAHDNRHAAGRQLWHQQGRDQARRNTGWNKRSGTARPVAGPFNYIVDVSRFQTEGYRDHSSATRYQANAKLTYRFTNEDTLTLVLNELHQGNTQDPLGLTRAQVIANPRQADISAHTFNTRKSIDNTQGGLVYEHKFSPLSSVKLIGYAGTRQVEQFLAVPRGAQIPETQFGGRRRPRSRVWRIGIEMDASQHRPPPAGAYRGN